MTSEFTMPPLEPGLPDNARVTIELKVDQRGSTGLGLKVERPGPGPIGLNRQTWVPRSQTHYVGVGEHFACEYFTVPAWLYKRLADQL